MAFTRRQILARTAAAAASSLAEWPSHAAEFPTRPIRLICPFPPGAGSADPTCRLLAEKMGATLRQPVVVDNKPGAGGMIGSAELARAAPDGYTIGMIGVGALALTPYMRKNVQHQPGWDPQKNFVPIAKIIDIPLLLVVSPTLPVSNVRELVALVKANPGKYSYSSDGVATLTHVAFEMFKQEHGLDVVHIPYATQPAVPHLMSGQVHMSIIGATAVIPFVKDGKLRALAFTQGTRGNWLPDVPTMVEEGYKDFVVAGWSGFFAPAGTPQAMVDVLADHTLRALRLPDVQQRLNDMVLLPSGSSPREMDDLVRRETTRWVAVSRNANISLD